MTVSTSVRKSGLKIESKNLFVFLYTVYSTVARGASKLGVYRRVY